MLNVITLCSGYDAPLIALEQLGFNYKLQCWAEIDPTAIKAHNLLFPSASGINYGDITDTGRLSPHNCDLITYSTPCQDVSYSGLRQGIAEGSNTRSSIVWSVLHWLNFYHPKVAIMENVKGLLSTNFLPLWIERLKQLGYTTRYIVTDAAQYLPQHRERVFVISWLNHDAAITWSPYYIGQNPPKLAEMLDKNPDIKPTDVLKYKNIEIAKKQIVPTLRTKNCIHVIIKQGQRRRILSCDGLAPTITTDPREHYDTPDCVRRLTINELYKLQGVPKRYRRLLISSDLTKTQHRRLAGNSICVPQIAAIFSSIYKPHHLFSDDSTL